MSLSDGVASGLSYIEQVAATCETPRRPFLRGVNHEQRRAVFFQPRCKLWSCPACAEINKSLWAVRAYSGAEQLIASGQQINFLTLTSHERLDAAASLAVWPQAWDKLRKRANRFSGGFQYLLVPEQHKDGRLHVHALETAGLGERWWKDNGRECGLGFMAEEEEARTAAGSANYTVKYISKGLQYTAWPRGFRRVRTSRGFPKPPELPIAEGWEWGVLPQTEQLDRAFDDLQRAGYVVALYNHIQAWQYVTENAPE